MIEMDGLCFPDGKSFAFTVLDDTDDTTLRTGKPVYDYLFEKGIICTKTVWALSPPPGGAGAYAAGSTLQDIKYRSWVKELAEKGYEIAFHNASMVSSKREDTLKAILLIEDLIGIKLRLHCNHGQNKENLFWGDKRYDSGFIRWFVRQLNPKSTGQYVGDDEQSDYFWLDFASQYFDYMRSFTYQSLLYAEKNIGAPYKKENQRWNGCFFATADAPTVYDFNRLVNERDIDKLAKRNGYAIVSTHFGKGFYSDGVLNKKFKRVVDVLVDKGGWFVPVSALLDYIRIREGGCRKLSKWDLRKIEYFHLIDRVSRKLIYR